MRSQYKVIDTDGYYFTTSTIIEWIPIFTSKPYLEIIIEALRYCQSEKNLKIFAYIILDNHFHMICQGPQLSQVMQSLKRHTAKQILNELAREKKDWILNLLQYYKKRHKKDSRYQVWQEGFHPKQIMTDDMFRQKIEYIHYNPVKRGYVSLPEYWYYSSANTLINSVEGPIKLDDLPF